jgi:monoamine oxidase
MQHEDAILDRLAREILMVDSRGKSLIPQYLQILEHGLSKPLPPDATHKDVIVVGAGIAGLVAGKLLKGAGYNVTIVEANDNRIGGRVKTFHTTPDRGAPFQDPKQYGEAGAMRIPNEHKLVNKLIEIMGLGSKAQLFYNVDVAKDDPSDKTFRTWFKTNGIQARRYAYNKGQLPPDQRTMGFPVPKEYQDQTADALLSKALEKPNRLINPSQPIEGQIEGWKQVIKEFDEFSMLRYLRRFYPESVTQYVGTLQNLTSRLFLSFMHSFIDTFYISPNVKYYELAGGNWQLPYAFLPYLQENLVMDSRAIEIQWSDPAHKLSAPKAVHHGKPGVYVRTINEPMTKRGVHLILACPP